MRLSDIISNIEYVGTFEDRDVKDVVIDSRKVRAGSVFVCIKGRSFDGHNMAQKAIESGAAAVVTERRLGLPQELTVKDARLANVMLCQNFFGNPEKKLTLIAVTGTNGKTTVTSVIKQALEKLGHKAGLIGTVWCEIGDVIVPAKFTTPEPWELAALMAKMAASGCEYLVMEASSQGLEQGRLLNERFKCGVFTNLTQDHLDYHGTLENYYQAKKLLFDSCETAVVNIDDPHGERLFSEIDGRKLSFSTKSDVADYTAKSIDYSIHGVRFAVSGDNFISRISFGMPGQYSAENALAAATALFAAGFDRDKACEAVSATGGVRGRCEVLHSGDVTVICDFAHTADALEKLLSSLRPFVEGRMVTLFGMCGDRDPKKRPAMAEAVCRYSDMIVLTSDNPRTEDPFIIMEDARPIIAASGVPFTAQADRRDAILWALNNLKKGDVLMLCGKGHEDYQVIDGCTIYLDEHKIVADWFKQKEEEKQ